MSVLQSRLAQRQLILWHLQFENKCNNQHSPKQKLSHASCASPLALLQRHLRKREGSFARQSPEAHVGAWTRLQPSEAEIFQTLSTTVVFQ